MKKVITIFSVFIFAIFTLTSVSQAGLLSFKFAGGYGMIDGKDYNTFLKGNDAFLTDLATVTLGVKEGEIKEIKYGLEYYAEAFVHLGPLAVGVGAGYIQRRFNTSSTVSSAFFYSWEAAFKPNFTVYPVTASLYLSIPSPIVELYLTGGAGYYFGKASYSHNWVENGVEVISQDGSISTRGIGYHAAIGLKFKVIPGIALFVEGRGRYCQLKDWEGDETTSILGTPYANSGSTYFIELDPGTGTNIPLVVTGASAADIAQQLGLTVVSEKSFILDLTGFALMAGIIINL